MIKQPEALRLADAIDPCDEGSKNVLTIDVSNAAKELRRLHKVNEELMTVLKTLVLAADNLGHCEGGQQGCDYLEQAVSDSEAVISKIIKETE